MGIPGILKEIGRGERVALSRFAIEHLERTNRPLRIAIDAAIWNFQHQASQGGKNPALRTLFFRLLKLLALPIHPVFVYDGKNKPLTKRGKTVSRYGTCIENEASKRLLSAFRFPHHTAPGEAEAECALLQKKGIVDAVMSQDVDAIMFGSASTLRDWSKEGTRGNKTPTHISVLDLSGIKRVSGLEPDGMILVALLSGGDYNEAGVSGFGPTLACEIARAGFGSDLLDLMRENDLAGLQEWRDRLDWELQTNESGYFRTKHPRLRIPVEFPDPIVLGYYTAPVVSKSTDLPNLESSWSAEWKSELDVLALRRYTADMFDWKWKSGCRSFIRRMAQPLLQDRLIRGTISYPSITADSVTDERKHFTSDGMIELRLTVTPAECVEVDLEAEEDNPEFAVEEDVQDGEDEQAPASAGTMSNHAPQSSAEPIPVHKLPWDPYSREKWWVPQTILQLGLPSLVEAWQQRQRDLHADPRAFATRKATKISKSTKKVDQSMKSGAMEMFLQPVAPKPSPNDVQAKPRATEVSRVSIKPSTPASPGKRIPSIAQYFRIQKFDVNSVSSVVGKPACEGHLDGSNLSKDASHTHESYGTHGSPQSSNPMVSISTKEMLGGADRAVTEPASSDNAIAESRIANVTQRKRRLRKQPSAKGLKAAQPESVSAQSKTIDPDISGAVAAAVDADTSRPPKDYQTGISVSHLSVASRESLPGAWVDTQMAPADRRTRRITYVDLTGD